MTTAARISEFNAAEDPASRLVERLSWTYVPRNAPAFERRDEGGVLLMGRVRVGV